MADPQQLDEWLGKLREGTLTEADLKEALARLKEEGAASRPQRLLYLQTETTAVDSAVKGMSVVEDGKVHETAEDPDDWPYGTVIAAINDGWRVVKFPELALLYQDSGNVGLACEFILEKGG